MNKYPKPITKQCTKIIIEQIDNSICKIKDNKGIDHVCFLCYIKCENNNIPVLITTYNIINEKYIVNKNTINIFINNELIEVEFGDIKYLNKTLDLSIVEIKNGNNEKLKFIEIDKYLYDNDYIPCYKKETIYIIHNYDDKNNCISYGVINNMNKSELLCSCNINSNSNGAPIFNISNNKLIGVYKNTSNYYAKGIFFKFIISEFIQEYKYSKKEFKYNSNSKNEINILVKVEKEDIKKKIYFLDNYKYKDNLGKKHNIDNLTELDKFNTELYIDGKKVEFKKYFITEKEGEYNINLTFNVNITDSSYMFAGCENIININFISFNTKYIANMKYMFYECRNLKKINLFSFDTRNVKDMSYMFFNCWALNNLDISFFNIKKVTNLNNMICNSSVTNKVYIDSSSKDITNQIHIVVNINKEDINKKIFFLSNSIDDLMELNISNAVLFINKKKHEYKRFFVPNKEGEYDIYLKFDNYLTDCSCMFNNCKNIIYIDFNSFYSNNITNMGCMFNGCHNLKSLNISS